MAGSFLAVCLFNVNVVLVIIICGLIGAVRTRFGRKEKVR